MCGIVGLHLRDSSLHPHLGELLAGMLAQVSERGPDSAGIGLYGDPDFVAPGWATVTLVDVDVAHAELAAAVAATTGLRAAGVLASRIADVSVLSATAGTDTLCDAVRTVAPGAVIIGRGTELAVLKGVGDPRLLIETFGLAGRHGYQGLAHTRMATESAVTAAHCHPFAVADDLCVVHNGSFSNHATVRRELAAEGVRFDSDNDSEVAARFIASQLAEGADLEKSLRMLGERLDGFYTLLVTTADTFAVVRDRVACKPAVVAETSAWVAMASEYRALAGLPGIGEARVFEPVPEEVYTWSR
jgi:amidophosphoribosyltransferase